MLANRRVSQREVLFRRALWEAGARGYRLHARLPGRPDLVFPALKLAVFVHGCFWHGCIACQLPIPKANREFWVTKVTENRARDDRAQRQLEALGWRIRTIWEHEIRPDPVPRAREFAAEISSYRMGCRSDS